MLQATAQHLGKQVVIAVPALLLVERDQKQVGTLHVFQQDVSTLRLAGGLSASADVVWYRPHCSTTSTSTSDSRSSRLCLVNVSMTCPSDSGGGPCAKHSTNGSPATQPSLRPPTAATRTSHFETPATV